MATYKVIQDIEAEDKFVGPLTLKQFIFAAIGVIFGWLNFLAVTKGAFWVLAFFFPPMLLGFFLAIPWSKEQPTEVWVLAKLRFRFKPKIRIWNQDGLQELVTITVPKIVERHLTDNLSQTEVKSRLQALADTIDSRGWAVKHALVNVAMTEETSDRLVSPTILPRQVPTIDGGAPDMMDDHTPVSANFDQMIVASDQIHMENTLEQMDRARRGEPAGSVAQSGILFAPPLPMPTVARTRDDPAPTPSLIQPINTEVDEETLAQQLKERRDTTASLYGSHKIDVRGRKSTKIPAPTDDNKAQADMTTSATPAIIQGLSQTNDLNVDVVAREAKRAAKKADDNEVVVNLH